MMPPTLSIDAKAVLGSVFQNGCGLSFCMVESKPTARMQAALDELVKAEMIVRENGVLRGPSVPRGVKYKARVSTEMYRRFASKADIIIAEPVKG